MKIFLTKLFVLMAVTLMPVLAWADDIRYYESVHPTYWTDADGVKYEFHGSYYVVVGLENRETYSKDSEFPDLRFVYVPEELEVSETIESSDESESETRFGKWPVKEVASGAFKNVTGLGTVSLGQTRIQDDGTEIGIEVIRERAFEGCDLRRISIGSTTMTIEPNAFLNCSNLQYAFIQTGSTVGSYAFKGCTSLKICDFQPYTNQSTKQTILGTGVFEGCSSLMQVSSISVNTSFGDECFKGCSSLPALYFYDRERGAISFGANAFEDCTSFKSFYVTPNIKSIGKNAFKGSGVNSVDFTGDINLSIDEETFAGIGTVEEPASIVYTSENQATILELMGTPDNGVYTLGGGKFKIIQRTGVSLGLFIEYQQFGEEYALSGYLKEDEVEIPEELWISSSVFSGGVWNQETESYDVDPVEFPVTSIKANALRGLAGIPKLTLPYTLEKIGANAFAGTSFTKLRILEENGKVPPFISNITENSLSGFGSEDAPATIEAPTSIIAKFKESGTLVEGTTDVYNVGGGYFRIPHIAVYAEKNPDNDTYYVMANGETEDGTICLTENCEYAPVTDEATVGDKEFYCYDFVGVSTLTSLSVSKKDTDEEIGEFFNPLYGTADIITNDTYLYWSTLRKALVTAEGLEEDSLFFARQTALADSVKSIKQSFSDLSGLCDSTFTAQSNNYTLLSGQADTLIAKIDSLVLRVNEANIEESLKISFTEELDSLSQIVNTQHDALNTAQFGIEDRKNFILNEIENSTYNIQFALERISQLNSVEEMDAFENENIIGNLIEKAEVLADSISVMASDSVYAAFTTSFTEVSDHLSSVEQRLIKAQLSDTVSALEEQLKELNSEQDELATKFDAVNKDTEDSYDEALKQIEELAAQIVSVQESLDISELADSVKYILKERLEVASMLVQNNDSTIRADLHAYQESAKSMMAVIDESAVSLEKAAEMLKQAGTAAEIEELENVVKDLKAKIDEENLLFEQFVSTVAPDSLININAQIKAELAAIEEEIENSVSPQEEITVDDAIFVVNDEDNSAEFSGASEEIVGGFEIPESIVVDGEEVPVTSIGAEAFSDCSEMTSVVIPESITSIGEGAFAGCTGLEDIYCYNPEPIELIASEARTRSGEKIPSQFVGIDFETCVLHVPAGASIQYYKTEGWNLFINIVEMAPTRIQDDRFFSGNQQDVYDIHGRKIKSAAKSLDSLPKGVYIINGKKVVK